MNLKNLYQGLVVGFLMMTSLLPIYAGTMYEVRSFGTSTAMQEMLGSDSFDVSQCLPPREVTRANSAYRNTPHMLKQYFSALKVHTAEYHPSDPLLVIGGAILKDYYIEGAPNRKRYKGFVVIADITDPQQPRCIHTLRDAGDNEVQSVAFSNEGFLVAGAGKKVFKYQPSNLEVVSGTITTPKWIESVDISPDAEQLIIGGWNLNNLYDLTGQNGPESLPRVLPRVRDADFSLGGEKLAIASAIRVVILEWPTYLQLSEELKEADKNWRSGWQTPESSKLYAVYAEIKQRISELPVIFDHEANVRHVRFSRDAKWLAVSCENFKTILYDLTTTGNSKKVIVDDTKKHVAGLDFNLYGSRLAIASGQKVSLYDPGRPESPVDVLDDIGETISSIAYSSDGERLVVVGAKGKAIIYKVHPYTTTIASSSTMPPTVQPSLNEGSVVTQEADETIPSEYNAASELNISMTFLVALIIGYLTY